MSARNNQNPTETLWRSLKTLSVMRVVIAAILFALLTLNNSKYIWSIAPAIYRDICLVYITVATVFVILQMRIKRLFLWQLGLQGLSDTVIISMLYYFAGGLNTSLTILYLFPLASCAILAPLTWALFLSSLVTVFLLLVSSLQILQTGSEAAVYSSGLYGGAFFAIVFAVNRLANRLIRQEELALLNGKNLRIQQEINKLVVADMDDGIIVVDASSRVYASNPASKKMLGIALLPGISKLSDMPSLLPIADAYFSWRNQISDLDIGWADTIAFAAVDVYEESMLNESVMVKGVRRDIVTHLKLRFVNVDAAFGPHDERCIIFLQDASEIENQAQQLKLASMGRLTASIAHEVRNPLSSISYAAALLAEDELSPAQSARLIKIVNNNVVRLNQLIEDILRLSRKAQIDPEPFLLKPMLLEIIQEFVETHGVATDVIQLFAQETILIRFDLMHLREVLVNLLTNAIRYASGRVGSIQLFVVADLADQLELHVRDDGPGISAEVRAHLFEPFYTTASSGTGLGLYMARELCLNNGALLDYEYRVTEMHIANSTTKVNGRFVITFVKPKQHESN